MARTLRDLLPPLWGKWKLDGIAFGEYPKGPDGRNLCRWCHEQVPTRKKQQVWCGQECIAEHGAAKGHNGHLRIAVLDRDKGVCAACGLDCDAFGKRMVKRLRQLRDRRLGSERIKRLRDAVVKRGFDGLIDSPWQADHIVARSEGGSSLMGNIQTLCTPCHKSKTAVMKSRLAGRLF